MNQDNPLGGDFQAFYQAHVKPLRAYFRRLGVSRSEQLDDLIQDTFLESYRGWLQLRSDKAARAWLFTIGRRQLAHMIKKGRQLVLDFSVEASTTAEPEHDLHAQRLCQIILHCLIQTASDAKRQALTAYFLEEKSFREIELEMNINLSTLTTWCSRFRHECLNRIEKHQSQGQRSHLFKKGARL